MSPVCCDWSSTHAIRIELRDLRNLVTKEKGWNSNEAFLAAEKSSFCGRKLLPFVCTLGFVTADRFHGQNPYNTPKERGKSIIGHL